ncbi:MAG: hypothetical protein ABIJ56_18030, partial [Pseudomonadota bacterium]
VFLFSFAFMIAGCSCSSGSDTDADAGEDIAADDAGAEDTAAEDTPTEALPDADDEEITDDPEPDPPQDPAPDDGPVEADEPIDTLEVEDVEPEPEIPPTPEGCIEGDFTPYWGVLHCHTSYSDGEQLPSDAFAHARDVAGLDILYVTDHLEQLYLPTNRWENCRTQADEANAPGSFLAACGYEYGSGFILPWFWSTGHNNVFSIDYLMPEIQVDFHNFYSSVAACPDCITQYNHPGSSEHETWNDFEYFADVDEKMNLFEFNSDPAWDLFFQAMDAGWHISPMWNQDNHSANWGTANDRRSGFFMADLTRDALHTAMRQRRSFMSYDKNAYVKIMAAEACWMGSMLSGVADIAIDAEAVDADADDGFATIEFYGPGKTLLHSFECEGAITCTARYDLAATGPTYIVARATQTDGNWLVSAPVWVTP